MNTTRLICSDKMAISRNRKIYLQWKALQKNVGQAKFWPPHMRKLFWKKDLTGIDRKLMVLFCIVNGITMTDFFQWTLLHGSLPSIIEINHVRALFKICKKSHSPSLFAFCVHKMHYLNVDGTVHDFT